jgi:hypothetical protein
VEIVNRVAQSGLVVIKLETLLSDKAPVSFDLADYLFKGLILREKDFRTALKEIDWKEFEGKEIALHCTADAIIPLWAWMLVVIHAEPYAAAIFQANPEQAEEQALIKRIEAMDLAAYEGQRLVIKGCADRELPPAAFTTIARRLRPIAKSIMFGEPCSTVPLYKKKA